jgi:hypothetical protein
MAVSGKRAKPTSAAPENPLAVTPIMTSVMDFQHTVGAVDKPRRHANNGKITAGHDMRFTVTRIKSISHQSLWLRNTASWEFIKSESVKPNDVLDTVVGPMTNNPPRPPYSPLKPCLDIVSSLPKSGSTVRLASSDPAINST